MSKTVSSVLALSISMLAACAPEALRSTAETRDIAASDIESHMRFLASDELEGRATATPGHLRAAEYVADRFAEIGLEPAGDNAGYYQPVPLIAGYLLADRSRLALLRGDDERVLEIETDYVLEPDVLRQAAELTAPLAFVGFGIRAPELRYDDYADIDVKGKIVVMLHGAPARFPGAERAYYSCSEVKLQTAVDSGAVGVVYMRLPDDRENEPWERSVKHSRMPSMRWLGGGGRPQAAHGPLFVVATLSAAGEAALFAGEKHRPDRLFAAAEAGQPLRFDLASRLSVLVATQHERSRSVNVLGRLPGSDPQLAAQHVVVTAHLDHIGALPVEAGGDGIHNGAYDNASGVALLLEMAAALARVPERPRRSVLFAAVTGHEKGLLGSEYLVEHPPLDSELVADINLDTVLMFHPLNEVVAFGAEQSTLQRTVERAASKAGVELDVGSDPIPEFAMLVRSDQYSFVRKGIPSISLISGFDVSSGDGLERFRDWMRNTYHTPQDDMGQTFDFMAAADLARINLRIAIDVANAGEPPRWHAGSFFGRRFGTSPEARGP